MLKIVHDEIFEEHAEFCKMLSNARRLKILALLGEQDLGVGEIASVIDIPMANVSQHLAILKSHGIVSCRKEGKNVVYRLIDKRLVDACDLIRAVLLDSMEQRGIAARNVSSMGIVVEH